MVVVLCCMQLHHKDVSVLLVTKFMCCSFFQSTQQTVELFKEVLKTKSPFLLHY